MWYKRYQIRVFVFQVKTTNVKKYCVRPNMGIIKPLSACEVTCMNFFLLLFFYEIIKPFHISNVGFPTSTNKVQLEN